MKTFTYSIFIATTPAQLWEALTSPEFTRQYWQGNEIRSDWKVGAPIALVTKEGNIHIEGTVLTYDPYNSLSYTFDVAKYSDFQNEPISIVTYQLEKKGDVMKLTIFHEELSERLASAVAGGWAQHMSSLKSLLETGKAMASPV